MKSDGEKLAEERLAEIEKRADVFLIGIMLIACGCGLLGAALVHVVAVAAIVVGGFLVKWGLEN